jgi:hypothetical protein
MSDQALHKEALSAVIGDPAMGDGIGQWMAAQPNEPVGLVVFDVSDHVAMSLAAKKIGPEQVNVWQDAGLRYAFVLTAVPLVLELVREHSGAESADKVAQAEALADGTGVALVITQGKFAITRLHVMKQVPS